MRDLTRCGVRPCDSCHRCLQAEDEKLDEKLPAGEGDSDAGDVSPLDVLPGVDDEEVHCCMAHTSCSFIMLPCSMCQWFRCTHRGVQPPFLSWLLACVVTKEEL